MFQREIRKISIPFFGCCEKSLSRNLVFQDYKQTEVNFETVLTSEDLSVSILLRPVKVVTLEALDWLTSLEKKKNRLQITFIL